MLPDTRIEWVDAGRGLAIILVVLYHSARWGAAAGIDTDFWQHLNDILATLRMPLFFMLAGLFAQKWQTAGWRSLWQHKLSLFVWVFLIWSFIDSFSIMLGMRMQGAEGNYLYQVASVVWSPVYPRFELWFIWALGLFFVIAKLSRGVAPWLQLAPSAVISAIALSGIDLGNVGWNGILRYYFFFLVGVHLRRRILLAANSRRPIPRAAILVLWLALAVSGNLLGLNAIPGFYFVTALLGVAAGVVTSTLLAGSKRLRYIGARTLPVYLTHTTIVLVVCWFLYLAVPYVAPGALAVLATPFTAVIAIVVSLVLARAVAGRPILRYLYVQPPIVATGRRTVPPK